MTDSSPIRIGVLGAAAIVPMALTGPARSVPEVQVALIRAPAQPPGSEGRAGGAVSQVKMRTKTFVLTLVTAILVSCAPAVSPPRTAVPPTATSLAEGVVIINDTPGNLIGATLYGHGETAVILASRGGYSQSEWSQFARILADEGFTALTLGSQDDEAVTVTHVRYAIRFLRNNGFEHMICVGASNGASGCAYNANQPEIIGLVLITYHGSANLSKVTIPKLFMAAGLDDRYRPTTEMSYEKAAQPKMLVIVPGSSATGPSLLDTPGENLTDMLVDFLKQCAGE